MFPSTAFARRVGLRHPIVQAPMAGGASTVGLAAAVSNAGGLGTLAGALLAPQAIVEAVDAIRKLSVHPIGINLFVLKTVVPEVKLSTIVSGILPFVVSDIGRIALVLALPGLALWLPNTMFAP